MFELKRDCGECDVCCVLPSMEDIGFQKEQRTNCIHLDTSKETHKCTIYEDRPGCCSEFFCSWITGIGEEEDRPDKNGILTFAAEFNGGFWCVIVEDEPNALMTTGREMAIKLTNLYTVPIIVELFDSKNPTGDWTIIKKSLFNRTGKMRGRFVSWLDENQEIGIYELVNSHEE